MTIKKSTSPEISQETAIQKAEAWEVQHTQNAVEHSRRLQKINDILASFDLADQQEEEHRKFLLWQDDQFLETILNKPEQKRLQFLIQAHVDVLKAKGLTHLSADERLMFARLKKQLVGNEVSETKHNERLIETEKLETEDNAWTIIAEQRETTNISKTDQKIAELKAILINNPNFRDYSSLADFKHLFAELDDVDRHDEAWKRHILQRIINKLKSPWTLESIAQDLGWPETVAYRAFKSQLLTIEPSLQASFDRVAINLAGSLAQLKLWTDSLEGVNLDHDQLVKVDWNLTIEAWKTDRNLSLIGSKYKLKSPLDPIYERQFHQVTKEASDALAPLNAELNDLSTVLAYLAQVEQTGLVGQRLETTKAQIKVTYPDLYNTLGLENKASLADLVSTLNQQKTKLDESKTAIQKQAKTKLDALIAENRAEAKEKDQTITNMLQLFHAIGFDVINQNKLNTVIATVNINPHNTVCITPSILKTAH